MPFKLVGAILFKLDPGPLEVCTLPHWEEGKQNKRRQRGTQRREEEEKDGKEEDAGGIK